jgi:hypothetical protein
MTLQTIPEQREICFTFKRTGSKSVLYDLDAEEDDMYDVHIGQDSKMEDQEGDVDIFEALRSPAPPEPKQITRKLTCDVFIVQDELDLEQEEGEEVEIMDDEEMVVAVEKKPAIVQQDKQMFAMKACESKRFINKDEIQLRRTNAQARLLLF